MFAVTPLNSLKDAAVLRPVSTGSRDLSPFDVAIAVAAVGLVLGTLAPSVALVVAAIAAVGGVAWIALRVRAEAPTVLVAAQRDALLRATYTQISFAR